LGDLKQNLDIQGDFESCADISTSGRTREKGLKCFQKNLGTIDFMKKWVKKISK
jgi:hypothetical protein